MKDSCCSLIALYEKLNGDVMMIKIDNLCKSYAENKVLNNIELHIPTGSIYGLVGRSGTGKSTLLRCINGLEKFQSGNLQIDGVAVQDLSKKDILQLRKEIGFIFQNFSLLERLSVYDNIALPMKCWKYSQSDIDKKVKSLLELVDISEKIYSKPRELSGGQKQRVAIARALAMDPKILLCDEATSALDPKTAQSVTNLLNRINKDIGITIVVVTHQMSVIRSCCEHIAILENGSIVESGSVSDVFLNQPSALVNLIGEKQLLYNDDEINMKVIYVGQESKQPILTKMARDLGIDFSINDADMAAYRDGYMGTIHISLPNKYLAEVSKYLNEHDMRFQVLNDEDNKGKEI